MTERLWEYSSYSLIGAAGYGIPTAEMIEGIPRPWDVWLCVDTFTLLLMKENQHNAWETVAEAALEDFAPGGVDLRYCHRGSDELDPSTFVSGDVLHDAILKSALAFVGDYSRRGHAWFEEKQ